MLFPAFFTTSSIVLLCDKASIQSNNSIILISIHIFELNHHFFHWRTRQTGDKNLPSGQKWIYRELCNNGLTKNEMKTVHKSRAIFFSSDNPKLPLDSYCTFYHYTYFSRLSYNLSDFFFLLYMKKKFSFYWKMTPTTTLKDFTLCVSFYHAWTDFFRDLYYMVPIYGDMQCKVNFYWKIIVDLVFYEMFFWYSILNWY